MSEKTPAQAGDFLAEAHELVEQFYRQLTAIESGEARLPLLSDSYRQVHSIKGIAMALELGELTEFAHTVESLLDRLSAGELELDDDVLAVMFEASEQFSRELSAAAEGRAVAAGLTEELRLRIDQLSRRNRAGTTGEVNLGISDEVIEALTHHEHRHLRSAIRRGLDLVFLRSRFAAANVTREIDRLRTIAATLGEVIACIPGPPTANNDVPLDILLASEASRRRGEAALRAFRPAVEWIPILIAEPAVDKPRRPVNLPSLRPPTQAVRVDIRRLDALMSLVGELSLAQAGLAALLDHFKQVGLLREGMALEREMEQVAARTVELQRSLIAVRMVPLKSLFNRLARVCRQLGQARGRPIQVATKGGDTMVDKLIVDELADPLMHLVRNALDHGIESDRGGKADVGAIQLEATHDGGIVRVSVRDDGRGIDPNEIAIAAREHGVATAEELYRLTPAELLRLVFAPGMSTRQEADHVSGRGVGLDAVHSTVSRLGGYIDITSEPGQGTEFVISLPLTLALVQSILVQIGDELFAVPVSGVVETAPLPRDKVEVADGRETIMVRKKRVPLVWLRQFVGDQSAEAEPEPSVVLTTVEGERIGVVVDDVAGYQNIVIKPLGPSLSWLRAVRGATELGAGKTVLVIDLPAVCEHEASRSRDSAGSA